jgi:hypothetical protein
MQTRFGLKDKGPLLQSGSCSVLVKPIQSPRRLLLDWGSVAVLKIKA